MSDPTILIVDDEPGILRTMQRILSSQYKVESFSSGIQALAQFNSIHPQLAVLDVQMPGIDGFSLMKRLKDVDPELSVILMTGSVLEAARREELIRSIREKAFFFIAKPFDREVMLVLIDRCLELRNLQRKEKEYLRRLEQGLAEAQLFQQSLLPDRQCVIEGIRVSAIYLPCDELGGDLFDYMPTNAGDLAFLVADVSGHGTSAAMLTAVVKAAFHSSSEQDYDPHAVISQVSASMRTLSSTFFVSLVCGRISSARGQVEYINAGHPSGVIRKADGEIMRLESTGPIVTQIPLGSGWNLGRESFEAGDSLVIVTDGILEARCEDVEFGEERMLASLDANAESQTKVIEGVLASLYQFTGTQTLNDDLTIVAFALEAT